MQQKAFRNEVSRKISFYMLAFIFIVVLFHSDFRYYYPFIEDLTAVSTSYFFCVSAYFFYRGLTQENYKERIKKRCFTLLLPYLLWNVIYMILYFRIYHFSVRDIIDRLTINPMCTPSWYLLTLFIFLLPSPLIMRAFRNQYAMIAVLLLGLGISLLGYVVFQREVAAIPIVGGYLVRMTEYVTPYLIGAFIGTRFSEKIYVGWKNMIFGVLGSCMIVLLLLGTIPAGIRWMLWVILPLILWEMIPERVFLHLKFLPVITEPAFLINMMHCYFLFLWGNILGNSGFVTGKYFSAFVVVMAVLTSYLLYYMLKLIVPGVLKVLTGNRSKRSN